MAELVAPFLCSYISFVYALGRFLRLSISNMRMRIPYDDLPNTSRLIALCQVWCAGGVRV